MQKHTRLFHPLTISWLALRDMWADKLLTFCSVITIMAVIAPMVVVAGLRGSVLNAIQQSLLEDPHAREIITVANRSFSAEELDSLRQRPEVAFLVPKTRALAASLFVEKANSYGEGRILTLIATQPHDPLLGNLTLRYMPDDTDIPVILSAAAADYLHAERGMILSGVLNRLMQGLRQSVHLKLAVKGIAPPDGSARPTLFVPLSVTLNIEAFQDGREDWPTHPLQAPPLPASYAGFRLYTHTLQQVPSLDHFLRNQGIDIVSRAGDVEGLLNMNRNLSLLFLIVASLGGTGLLVSIGAGLWANMERKRISLSLLRFSGMSSYDLVLFPLIQGSLLAFMGTCVGLGASLAASAFINHLFMGLLPNNLPLCEITPLIALLTFSATLGGAVSIALLAGRRASHIQAWEGLTAV